MSEQTPEGPLAGLTLEQRWDYMLGDGIRPYRAVAALRDADNRAGYEKAYGEGKEHYCTVPCPTCDGLELPDGCDLCGHLGRIPTAQAIALKIAEAVDKEAKSMRDQDGYVPNQWAAACEWVANTIRGRNWEDDA